METREATKPAEKMDKTRWCHALKPLLFMWKVRLPLIALPVLAGLRRLASMGEGAVAAEARPTAWMCEVVLAIGMALVTGVFQVPFSVTWWFVLIAAFALETPLLIGVATVLSLTVVLGWYGAVLRHPHAISALWSCGTAKAAEEVLGASAPVRLWQVWDVVVHGLPAVLMLIWHGPGLDASGAVGSGMVSPAAVLLALPLNLIWFWGMCLGLGKSVWRARLSDTNAVYQVEPLLPDRCWHWIYGSHWAACTLWLVLLTFPSGIAIYAAVLPVLWAWTLLARLLLREDLLLDRATFFLVVHGLGAWGICRLCSHSSRMRLILEVVAIWQVSGFGITCGAHRLWSHRSYTARLPFRAVLMLLNTVANQGTIYHWVRDHRAHHKYTDTAADPHDTRRGFFFAHMGWLLVPKTPELKEKGKSIPCGDLLADPVVAFQKRAEEKFLFMELVSFGLPALYGHYVYSDALLGFLVHGMLRWLVTLHATWCVNSVAHYFGDNPYDPQASARESWFTSLVADGEGWHSYHHKYPWDYATSEFGAHRRWNPSKVFIDFAAALGQVTHFKRANHMVHRSK